MMKKIYHFPKMMVLQIQHSDIVCVSTNSNTFIHGGDEGSASSARVKEQGEESFWEESWQD